MAPCPAPLCLSLTPLSPGISARVPLCLTLPGLHLSSAPITEAGVQQPHLDRGDRKTPPFCFPPRPQETSSSSPPPLLLSLLVTSTRDHPYASHHPSPPLKPSSLFPLAEGFISYRVCCRGLLASLRSVLCRLEAKFHPEGPVGPLAALLLTSFCRITALPGSPCSTRTSP